MIYPKGKCYNWGERTLYRIWPKDCNYWLEKITYAYFSKYILIHSRGNGARDYDFCDYEHHHLIHISPDYRSQRSAQGNSIPLRNLERDYWDNRRRYKNSWYKCCKYNYSKLISCILEWIEWIYNKWKWNTLYRGWNSHVYIWTEDCSGYRSMWYDSSAGYDYSLLTLSDKK